jgi:hypothetical protein
MVNPNLTLFMKKTPSLDTDSPERLWCVKEKFSMFGNMEKIEEEHQHIRPE